jgi:20S proteasome subunit beta 1
VYGYIDAHYRKGMTREECEEFTAKAIAHAMARDGASGGVIRLASIDKDGVRRSYIPGNKLPYKPETEAVEAYKAAAAARAAVVTPAQ